MKTIDNYILERLNPRHLGPTDKFPIDGTLDEVVEFLKRHGFEQVELESYGIVKQFNERHIRGFIISSTNIWFADTSKGIISEDNPVFVYRTDSKGYRCFDDSKGYLSDDIQGFKKRLNKRFGFLI